AEAVEDQVKNVETKATSVDESKNPKVPDHMRVWQVRTDRIVANKEQPRKIFIDEELESLTASIKEKGILQPITVRKLAEDKFEIIAGERRWRAAQRAGLQEVPVLLKDVDDSTSLELALIENIQREDLNPVEEAEAYFHLIKKYKMTQQQLAEKIGKERATVANVLRLLNLSPEVRKMVASCEISLGQAKALMALSDPKKQKSLAIKARDNQLSVRAVEKLVAKYRDSKKEEPTEQDILKDKSVETLRVELQRMLGTKVSIDYNTGKGKISIAFYSDEELNGIIDKIRESWKK
ncbi:MAG: ParB/RepB/Spo0J family partition protein, partial [Bdellovibrionales bacterium]|nr:ParB/RepB/Spo0J family partition protein [Bdellovibrionales bacterium]